jgi:hypothetical protein
MTAFTQRLIQFLMHFKFQYLLRYVRRRKSGQAVTSVSDNQNPADFPLILNYV